MSVDNALEKIVNTMLNALNITLSEKTTNDIIQFIKFCIVGVSNVLISYAIYVITLFILEYYGLFAEYDYIVSQSVSFVLSVLWSFIWNYKYVFEKDQKQTWFYALVKTYASYAFTGLFLSNALLYLFIDIIGLSKLLAPAITITINVPINYLLNKLWAFKSGKK